MYLKKAQNSAEGVKKKRKVWFHTSLYHHLIRAPMYAPTSIEAESQIPPLILRAPEKAILGQNFGDKS